MPYYIHDACIPAEEEILAACSWEDRAPHCHEYSRYTTRADMERYRENSERCLREDGRPVTLRVTLALTPEEYASLARERDAYAASFPLPGVWPCIPEHFAWASVKYPGKVAYYRDLTAALEGPERATAVTPGTYLKRHWPLLPDEEVARLAALLTGTVHTLALATTGADIVRVYQAIKADGVKVQPHVGSCMGPNCHSGSVGYRKGIDWCDHPARVYGESDLAIAYWGDIDNVLGRTVVWPAKKVYSRLYASDPHTFRELLARDGYREDSSTDFRGARIRRITHSTNGGYLMPYIDPVDRVRESGEYWVLGEGHTSCRETCGYIDGEDDNECARCGESFTDSDSDTYCQSCHDESWYCYRCDETYFGDDDAVSGYGGTYCRNCADLFDCAICGGKTTEYAHSRAHRQERAANGYANHVCDTCAGRYSPMPCASCEDWTKADDMLRTKDDEAYCWSCYDELPADEKAESDT